MAVGFQVALLYIGQAFRVIIIGRKAQAISFLRNSPRHFLR